MPLKRALRIVKRLDSESVFGITAKISNSGVYLVSSVLTGAFLSLSQQGIFFTFLSFATLTMLVELGLNTVIIQFTSHEMALVDIAPDDTARENALSRLRSIGRFAFLWFWSGAALFLLIVGSAGYYFFAGVPEASDVLPGPWLMLIVLVALDLSLNPFWSILEGARRINAVYAYRSVKALVLGIATWTALVGGLGLWSLPLGFLAALPLAVWPITANWDLFRIFLTPPTSSIVAWKAEMMPLQWRLAVTWVAGYFAQWSITPISLKMFGSAVAGQVGMTWALANGIGAIASAVVMVKSSRFGYLVATRQFAALDKLLLRQGLICIGLSVLGTSAVVFLAWFAQHMGYRAAHRILPVGILATFLFGSVLQQSTLPLAVYLRAFKREPFMWISVGSAILLILALTVGGRLFGIWGVALGYFASVLVVVPAGILIFIGSRRAWTAQSLARENG